MTRTNLDRLSSLLLFNLFISAADAHALEANPVLKGINHVTSHSFEAIRLSNPAAVCGGSGIRRWRGRFERLRA
ncbi:hypothetical protein EOS_41090 [Caballeronia mineralivorans PML1(12)]|uniref:Uncharacterized protein n=1 Tax=Caballeronia mineralivorans PML1(12) TaxID=908627 RepID=A0A0J1CIT9_9BURK|nr:hypothetical protein EOS_41090 [Caballeronia mineralivorans PML1(12)]